MTNLVKQWGAPHNDRRSRVPTSFIRRTRGIRNLLLLLERRFLALTNLSTMNLTCQMLSILKLVCKLQTTHKALTIVVRILETRECKTAKFCLPMLLLNTTDLSNRNVQHMVKSKLLQKSLGHLPCTKLENIHRALPLKITLCAQIIYVSPTCQPWPNNKQSVQFQWKTFSLVNVMLEQEKLKLQFPKYSRLIKTLYATRV